MVAGIMKPLPKGKAASHAGNMHLFSRLFALDIAIDLGTANTLVFVKYGAWRSPSPRESP
jgi:hypothetical protein